MKAPLRSLLGIQQLTTAQIESILALARRMDPGRPSQLLRGKRVVLLFYESSTSSRTLSVCRQDPGCHHHAGHSGLFQHREGRVAD